MSARACAIGLDVGGTYLKGARVASDGTIEARFHQPVAKASAEELFRQLAQAVASLVSSHQPVRAVGVGLPGIVDEEGRVRRAPNVSVLNGARVGEELARRCGAWTDPAALGSLGPPTPLYLRTALRKPPPG